MKEFNKKNIISNLFMLAGIMLFVGITSQIFGSNNTLIWVAIQISLSMFHKMDIGIDKKQAPFVLICLFLLIGLSNRLAMYNIFFGILLNFISIFIIMYIPSSKIEYKPYMPFILCYIFGQSVTAQSENFISRMLSLLIGSIIVAIVYFISHRKSDEKQDTLMQVIRKIDITSDRFCVALKMSIGVSIAIFIGTIIETPKTMWIALSVMSITQIDFEHTKKRFKWRIISTLIGSGLFVLLFQYLIPTQYTTLAVILLSYIYTFVEEYHIQVVFVTINALSSAMLLFDTKTEIQMRIFLVILGCLLGYIINKINIKSIFSKLKHIKEYPLPNIKNYKTF
ncbi:MAG: FUSC family protein [Clostridia bacterium]